MLSMIVLIAVHAGLKLGLSPFTLCVILLLSPVDIASNKVLVAHQKRSTGTCSHKTEQTTA